MVAFAGQLVGALLLAPLALRKGELRLAGGDARWVALIALVMVGGPSLLVAVGQQDVSSSLAGIRVSTTPILTVAVALAVDAEEFGGRVQLLGLGVGMTGTGRCCSGSISAVPRGRSPVGPHCCWPASATPSEVSSSNITPNGSPRSAWSSWAVRSVSSSWPHLHSAAFPTTIQGLGPGSSHCWNSASSEPPRAGRCTTGLIQGHRPAARLTGAIPAAPGVAVLLGALLLRRAPGRRLIAGARPDRHGELAGGAAPGPVTATTSSTTSQNAASRRGRESSRT